MIAVAEGSLIRGTPGRVGAALTKPGRVSTAEWCGSGERGTKADARNRRVKLFKSDASSNSVDLGWIAVRTRSSCEGGELWSDWKAVRPEVTVKDCGVTVTMPLEQSRPPPVPNG
jgi:hypothetical protein